VQTSPPIHNKKHLPPTANKSTGATAIEPDALLHATDADKEQMYNGREGSWYNERLSNESGES
jgi:hypothetical protein